MRSTAPREANTHESGSVIWAATNPKISPGRSNPKKPSSSPMAKRNHSWRVLRSTLACARACVTNVAKTDKGRGGCAQTICDFFPDCDGSGQVEPAVETGV